MPAETLPSESAVYRCLVRARMIEPMRRDGGGERFKRWERAAPMELWQMNVVGRFLLADVQPQGVDRVDDHSRFVSTPG